MVVAGNRDGKIASCCLLFAPDPPFSGCSGPVCCACLFPTQDPTQEVGSFRLMPFVGEWTPLWGYVLRDTRRLLYQSMPQKHCITAAPKFSGLTQQSFCSHDSAGQVEFTRSEDLGWAFVGLLGSVVHVSPLPHGTSGPAWTRSFHGYARRAEHRWNYLRFIGGSKSHMAHHVYKRLGEGERTCPKWGGPCRVTPRTADSKGT